VSKKERTIYDELKKIADELEATNGLLRAYLTYTASSTIDAADSKVMEDPASIVPRLRANAQRFLKEVEEA